MQRKYYRHDNLSDFPAPDAGAAMHAPRGEVVVPRPVKNQQPKSTSSGGIIRKILPSHFESDDIMLLGLMLMLLQDKEEIDFPLLAALGYIFFSDKDIFMGE